MRKSARHSSPALASAFTLLELLIAVSIFALVLAAINAVFFSALRLRNRSAAMIDRNVPVEFALATIRRDLLSIVPPGTNLFGPLQTTATTNAMPGLAGPVFFCASGALDQLTPWSDVQKVTYALTESSNRYEGRDLVRYVDRNLLALTPIQPVPQRLLGGVQSIKFSFYDGSQWREYWDSTIETPSLPRGIRVEIQRTAGTNDVDGPLPPPLLLVVPVMVSAPTNSAATAQ